MLDNDHVSTPADAEVQTPPTGKALLEAVALSLEARGSATAAGYEGIEYYSTPDVMRAPVDGTVFGWIAEELQALGVTATMNTVGETLAALGIHGGKDGIRSYSGGIINDETARHNVAHDIGCHCLGTLITAEDAAKRVRALMTS